MVNSESYVEEIKSFKNSGIFLNYISKVVSGNLGNGWKGSRIENDAS